MNHPNAGSRNIDAGENILNVLSRELGITKRKSDFVDFDKDNAKKSRNSKEVERRDKELETIDGVELKWVDTYVGHGFIPIEQIESTDKIAVQINRTKVMLLKKSMAQSFDPSLCVLTVTPTEENSSSSGDFIDKRYNVVHGFHR